MRDVNWVQVTRASFFVLAIIFSVSVALQVLIAGTALFVNSGGWAAHASFARYFACIPLIMAIMAWMAGLSRRMLWKSMGLFGMVIGMFLTAVLSSRIGFLSALHPVIALMLFWGSVDMIRSGKRSEINVH
ncbi:DUF6220 domain-containing protein [Paenibacillus lautus]|jgi:hypothetical protein|uniref:Uncharacterized protein n=1 Tax=Paenibacillus lautus TaxID=1401 RepID=A0A385TFE3_PAELA|nr:DUF6220 domain-containing protein [Paenibacillus lautus]AYB43290.1 hypothetical protein D5F53_08345 [Paenibacillus lautus]MCI1778310.1 DUF6220 domain-containing protein [Paenibacillus lautus]VTR32903.1 Uncharacterised protein [Actinobacillus pleuropneumoniae]